MTRLIAAILSLTLGLAAAFALVSCGSSDKGLLPGDTAEEIESNLELVQARAAESDCEGAQAAAAEISHQVENLGPEVKQRLREALAQGAEQVQEVAAECTPTETSSEITTDTELSDTETSEPDTELTETTESDTEPTEPTTEPTTTAEPTTQPTITSEPPTSTPPPPPPPGDGDGVGEGGGSGGIGPGRRSGLR